MSEQSNEEIRVKCAELMGWQCVHLEPAINNTYRGMPPHMNIRQPIPAFDSSMDAALTLCDRLRYDGWWIVIENYGEDWRVKFYSDLTVPRITCIALDASLPRAICKAFLEVHSP